MTYDPDQSKEDAFDRLVKSVLAEEWEGFPAPSARVWRALTIRLGTRAQGSQGSREGAAPLAENGQGSNGGDGHDSDSGAIPLRR
jgi:hypothetical protein